MRNLHSCASRRSEAEQKNDDERLPNWKKLPALAFEWREFSVSFFALSSVNISTREIHRGIHHSVVWKLCRISVDSQWINLTFVRIICTQKKRIRFQKSSEEKSGKSSWRKDEKSPATSKCKCRSLLCIWRPSAFQSRYFVLNRWNAAYREPKFDALACALVRLKPHIRWICRERNSHSSGMKMNKRWTRANWCYHSDIESIESFASCVQPNRFWCQIRASKK